MIKTVLKLFTIKIKLSYKEYNKKFTKLIKKAIRRYLNNDSFSNSVLNVLKSGDALTTSGKLLQILGA